MFSPRACQTRYREFGCINCSRKLLGGDIALSPSYGDDADAPGGHVPEGTWLQVWDSASGLSPRRESRIQQHLSCGRRWRESLLPRPTAHSLLSRCNSLQKSLVCLACVFLSLLGCARGRQESDPGWRGTSSISPHQYLAVRSETPGDYFVPFLPSSGPAGYP